MPFFISSSILMNFLFFTGPSGLNAGSVEGQQQGANRGPFTAYLTNLPNDACIQDLEKLFDETLMVCFKNFYLIKKNH